MNGSVTPTPYARALARCHSDSSRIELSRMSAEANLVATSPEWDMVGLVAESVRIFGTRDAEQAILAALARLERKAGTRTADQPHSPPRVFVVAAVVLMALLALVAWIAPWPWPWPAPVRAVLVPLPAILAAFSLGAVSGLGYFWLAPLVVELRRRFRR
jgi:hypothetical protein